MQEKSTVEKGLNYTGIIILFSTGIFNLYKSEITQLATLLLIILFITFSALKLRDDKRAGDSTQKAYFLLIASSIALVMTSITIVDTYLINRGI